MRELMPSVIVLLGALALAPAASGAEVFISIDKTTQRMSVSVDGEERYSWPVSTGMADYATPAGSFTPSRLARTHFSREVRPERRSDAQTQLLKRIGMEVPPGNGADPAMPRCSYPSVRRSNPTYEASGTMFRIW